MASLIQIVMINDHVFFQLRNHLTVDSFMFMIEHEHYERHIVMFGYGL